MVLSTAIIVAYSFYLRRVYLGIGDLFTSYYQYTVLELKLSRLSHPIYRPLITAIVVSCHPCRPRDAPIHLGVMRLG